MHPWYFLHGLNGPICKVKTINVGLFQLSKIVVSTNYESVNSTVNKCQNNIYTGEDSTKRKS